MYLRHKEINVSSTFERKIVVFGGWGRIGSVEWDEYHRTEYFRSMGTRVLGFIGFSCAAQCFLCVYCVLSNFQRQFWEMSFNENIFMFVVLLHFHRPAGGWEMKTLLIILIMYANIFFVHWQFHHNIAAGEKIYIYAWIIYGMDTMSLNLTRRVWVGWQESSGSFFQFQSIYSVVMYEHVGYVQWKILF